MLDTKVYLEELVRLEKLLHSMDIPWNRKKDLNPVKIKWLKKNLKIRNEANIHFNEAMSLIEKLT